MKPSNRIEAPKIDLRGAKSEFDRGRALFVDVRTREEYERSHVPGATSIPIREIARRAGELPRDRLILFY